MSGDLLILGLYDFEMIFILVWNDEVLKWFWFTPGFLSFMSNFFGYRRVLKRILLFLWKGGYISFESVRMVLFMIPSLDSFPNCVFVENTLWCCFQSELSLKCVFRWNTHEIVVLRKMSCFWNVYSFGITHLLFLSRYVQSEMCITL
jgi:hypothetical protein